MWFRVFGSSELGPQPGALLEHLQGHAQSVTGQFKRDDQGWFQVELADSAGSRLTLDRYLAGEDGIRTELNAWAAWLEAAAAPTSGQLMQHMIGTKQVFTVTTESAAAQPLCHALVRYLAGLTDGVYQIDGQGFFAADGTLLVPE